MSLEAAAAEEIGDQPQPNPTPPEETDCAQHARACTCTVAAEPLRSRVLLESWAPWQKVKMQNVYTSCRFRSRWLCCCCCFSRRVTLTSGSRWPAVVMWRRERRWSRIELSLARFAGGGVTHKCISDICLRSTFQRPLLTCKWSACMQGHEPPSPSHQCRLSHTYLPVKSFIPLITGQWLYQQPHQVFFYMLFTQMIWIIVYVDFGASLR